MGRVLTLFLSELEVSRSDVLVDVEKVIRIVLPLNFRQSIVVVAVGRFNPVDSFFHHEIYVSASQCVGMNGFPVFLGPRRNRFRLGRVGTDTRDDHRPRRVPERPGRLALPDAVDCAVDRIVVHQREFARRFGGTLQMHVDSMVGKLFNEVTFPVPLQACRQQWVKQALQSRERHGPHPVQDWLRKLLANRLDYLFRLVQRSAVARDQGADFLSPKLLREGVRRGYCLQPQKRAKLQRRLR